MELATLWNFQLQLYGILTCNFLHFYLATNIGSSPTSTTTICETDGAPVSAIVRVSFFFFVLERQDSLWHNSPASLMTGC
jgi:hypothetical protein